MEVLDAILTEQPLMGSGNISIESEASFNNQCRTSVLRRFTNPPKNILTHRETVPENMNSSRIEYDQYLQDHLNS